MSKREFVHTIDGRRTTISMDGTTLTVETPEGVRKVSLEGLFVEEILAAAMVRLGYLDSIEDRLPDDLVGPLNLGVVEDYIADDYDRVAAMHASQAIDTLYKRADHRKALGIYGK